MAVSEKLRAHNAHISKDIFQWLCECSLCPVRVLYHGKDRATWIVVDILWTPSNGGVPCADASMEYFNQCPIDVSFVDLQQSNHPSMVDPDASSMHK
jgi:hypothetical protein